MKFNNWPLLLRFHLLLYIKCTHSKNSLSWMQGCRLVACRSSTCFSRGCSSSVKHLGTQSPEPTTQIPESSVSHTWNTLPIHLQPHKGLEVLTLYTVLKGGCSFKSWEGCFKEQIDLEFSHAALTQECNTFPKDEWIPKLFNNYTCIEPQFIEFYRMFLSSYHFTLNSASLKQEFDLLGLCPVTESPRASCIGVLWKECLHH